MFGDSQAGANASMVVYIMVEMTKAHGLHPYSYLKCLLDSRPSTDISDTELANLTPWREKAKIACDSKSK